MEFSNITGTLYTHIQAINIAYVILHSTGKFNISIWECNRLPQSKNTWIHSKKNFSTVQRKLRADIDITVKKSGAHHAIMVRYIIEGLQEVILHGSPNEGNKDVPYMGQMEVMNQFFTSSMNTTTS